MNDYLNHYEMVSIGILEGILDGHFYRRWMRGPFVCDWNAVAELIERERWKRKDDGTWEYYDRIFENYGYLAALWFHEAIILHEKYRPPPEDEDAGAAADEPLPANSGEAAKPSSEGNTTTNG